MKGFEVADVESVVGEVGIFTSATGIFDIVTLAHLKKMRNDSIVGNIGHFDNERPASRASLASRRNSKP